VDPVGKALRFGWSPANVAALVSAGLLVVALSMVACATGARPEPSALAPLLGTWRGTARPVVDWCSSDLAIQLTIHADTTVTGMVGDATLVGGRIECNRSALGAALGLFSDWLIRGSLRGDLLSAEGLHRDEVKLPLNRDGQVLAGSLDARGNAQLPGAHGRHPKADTRELIAGIDTLWRDR